MIRRGIGVQSFVSAGGGGTDADAQAFITAAGITDATQQSAINTLVTDLKGYGIWTKMKAIYPMVGGTSSTHKWNLKDPRDLNAAFRLVFSGGWTHSSTGALPNGTNGFANTFYSPTAQTSITNTHASLYLRTGSVNPQVDFGSTDDVSYTNRYLMNYYYDSNSYFDLRSRLTIPNASIGGLVGHVNMVRTATNLMKAYKNGNVVGTNTNSSLVYGLPSSNLYLSALNLFGTAISFQNRQLAFATFGDGLTDTEAANLYTAVQAYQTTLGRSVGTQTVSDSDAQAFVNAAVIEDQVQATAINTLVTDLKGYGIWSKMKAIYPFVGNSASQHKWNLKDPRDLDAAFRLVFSGGATHSSTGYLPNGTNGYADTKLNENNVMTLNNQHISFYSRTNTTTLSADISAVSSGTETNIYPRYSNQIYGRIHGTSGIAASNTDSTGFYIANRTNSTQVFVYKNSTKYTVSSNSVAKSNAVFTLSAVITVPSNNYSNRELAFASIGDGLTDTEAANLYTAVQAYQTSLSRNV